MRYKPRSAIKGQFLADFVAEFSHKGEMVCQVEHCPWKVHMDGASSAKGVGVRGSHNDPGGNSLGAFIQIGV